MDPNETLQLIRALTEKIHEKDEDETLAQLGRVLAEAVDAMDSWLSAGGFLPRQWGGQANVPTLSETRARRGA